MWLSRGRRGRRLGGFVLAAVLALGLAGCFIGAQKSSGALRVRGVIAYEHIAGCPNAHRECLGDGGDWRAQSSPDDGL
jgi:hypothetical protein